MERQNYSLIEEYMASCMEDSAHDKEHVYRVLYNAFDIAKCEEKVDYDILITACLLHDIGRKEQFENPSLCHAVIGAEKAYRFLIEHDFPSEFAEAVRHCIQTHRFRKSNLPQTIEAKILFDADKLDVSGAIGIARTLIYRGIVSEPIYSKLPNGMISNGENDVEPSFFKEYKYKLEKLYSNFYTQRGAELATGRQAAAVAFYNNLFQEINDSYEKGMAELERVVR